MLQNALKTFRFICNHIVNCKFFFFSTKLPRLLLFCKKKQGNKNWTKNKKPEKIHTVHWDPRSPVHISRYHFNNFMLGLINLEHINFLFYLLLMVAKFQNFKNQFHFSPIIKKNMWNQHSWLFKFRLKS